MVPMLVQASAKPPAFITSATYYVINDDKPEYAQPALDKTAWQHYEFNGFRINKDISWIQIEFELPQKNSASALFNYGAFVSILGAFEAYWDGQLIGKNGIVGNERNSEIPGIIDKAMLIPSSLSEAGKHTLSLRLSSHHLSPTQTHGSFFSLVTDYQYLIQLPYKKASRPLIMSGALLLVAIYSLFIYFTSFKQPSHLIFSALCFTILSLMIVESWRGLWPYSYDWQIPRMEVVLALSCLTSILFTAFFAWFFTLSIKQRIGWLGAVVIAQLITLNYIDGYDNRSLIVFLIAIACATGLCLKGLISKQQHASLMLGGLLLFIAPISINIYAYMDQYFFLSFSALLCLMLYTLAQSMKIKHKQLIQSQLTSSRLELELVKRNLQPHFILNTLTAVEEWIEESPATAVKFINALADEFRFMAATSAQSLITLQDEIALCQSHLKVMGYRTNIKYSFKIDANLQSAAIAPGILLTLIENAISHNNYRDGNVEFSLVQIIKHQQQSLLFHAPVIRSKHHKKPTTDNSIHLGIGSKYIEARLTESFGQTWKINSVIENERWSIDLSFPLTAPCNHTATTKAGHSL